MIEFVEFPWSPFCLVIKGILNYSGRPFKSIQISAQDRTSVWKMTRQRYYGVPVIRDGRSVVFEVNDDSQVIAKYLDSKFGLGLFPRELEGVQSILWHYIENEIEGCTFRLNDAHYKTNVPPADQLQYLRFKERKFGRGCLEQWRAQEKTWLKQLAERLVPFEEMVMYRPFLLDDRPRFVDFDLFGMLANLQYSGKYRLPAAHTRLKAWHRRMANAKLDQ